jgi:hypothetical protein
MFCKARLEILEPPWTLNLGSNLDKLVPFFVPKSPQKQGSEMNKSQEMGCSPSCIVQKLNLGVIHWVDIEV